MPRTRIQWLKVLANMGVAFFSVLAGTLTVDALTGGEIPLLTLVLAASASALLQAGLAFFKELAECANRNGGTGTHSDDKRQGQNPGGRHWLLCAALNAMVLF